MGKTIGNRKRNGALGIFAFMLAASLACNTLTPQVSSSNNPSEPVLKVNPPTYKVENYPPSESVDGWVTVTGEKNLYTIDVPRDWLTYHWSQDGLDYFVDNFQSSDEQSYLEVFISDDGRPFPETDEKYIYALSVLERLYSNGVEVEKRSVDENGGETLIWNSQNSRFVSVYNVTNNTTFVMLTIYGYTAEKESSIETKGIIEHFKILQNSTPEKSSDIEYSSVAEALADLSKKEGIEMDVSQGWTIITEHNGTTTIMWSFAPTFNSAYPAVAKRVFFEDKDGWYVTMSILCEASKEECDKFKQDFENLNEEMRKYILKDQLQQFLEELQGK